VALPQLADDPRHGCLSRRRRAFDLVPVVVAVLEFPDAGKRIMSGSFPLRAMAWTRGVAVDVDGVFWYTKHVLYTLVWN
jgi:hypothetical protein